MSFYVRESLKEAIPWFLKIPAKVVLSRLPVSTRAWQKINVFRAGSANVPEFYFDVFNTHLKACNIGSVQGKTILEIGPGNELLTALWTAALGGSHSWLVDSENMAEQDCRVFASAAEFLRQRGLNPPSISDSGNLSSLLSYTYLTKGLDSLRTVPAASVDFLFSQAVMEHIRLAEFDELAREMRRVLKPDGVASHWVDFRDHLQSGLNNLRFSEKFWESRFMSSSGFYTNRIPFFAMKDRFANAGFAVTSVVEQRWPSGLPTVQSKMAAPFRSMPSDELMVMHAHIVLRPANPQRIRSVESP